MSRQPQYRQITCRAGGVEQEEQHVSVATQQQQLGLCLHSEGHS
jgi:hypothetical protein